MTYPDGQGVPGGVSYWGEVRMRKLGMVLAGVTCLLVGLLLLGGSDAQGGGGGEKKGKKLDAARLKIILNKIDPEIRAAVDDFIEGYNAEH